MTLQFGQIMLTEKRVWHRDNGSCSRALSSPAELRACVREAPFRAVPAPADLPAGWRVELDHPAQAYAVLETVYPGLVADWAAKRQGRFLPERLHDISERQVGMFKGIHSLATELIDRTVAKVCGACIRQPTWWMDDPASDLPCRAACNYWLSKAVKAGE